MLSITFIGAVNSPLEGETVNSELHVGNSIRTMLETVSKEAGFSSYQSKHFHAIYVQADGHELQCIFQQIQGIPRSQGSVCTWRGDLAAFIVDNLRLEKFEYQRHTKMVTSGTGDVD
jgi:hypothetical protein